MHEQPRMTMASGLAPPSIRPYRSKVHRPCDRCRLRKRACVFLAERHCQSCALAALVCTFELPPTSRRRMLAPSGRQQQPRPDAAQGEDQVSSSSSSRHGRALPAAVSPQSLRPPHVSSSSPADGRLPTASDGRPAPMYMGLTPPAAHYWRGMASGSGSPAAEYPRDLQLQALASSPGGRAAGNSLHHQQHQQHQHQQHDQHQHDQHHHQYHHQYHHYHPHAHPPLPAPSQVVQRVCSLDQIDGGTAHLCGISAELDPWLLRHCRYDEFGMRHLLGTSVRNVGGVPVDELVPVHFDVAKAPQDSDDSEAARRWELEQLVPPQLIERLVSLYVYFYPS
ncbi:hypothetical protein VTK73DRAFT_4254 [Phialemonium thermophilum]|uniref:Zn(2)-C6 fungal-type domain-containing protein n=1 Tax=Phialemonium thermophilum TaxID=223376 RepID=A0ABR3VA79_9PEZI